MTPRAAGAQRPATVCTCSHISLLHHPARGCLVMRCPCEALIAQPKRRKYGNVPCVGPMGELYDAKAERDYAADLERQFIHGHIIRWSWAPRFVLQDEPLITYRPDFLFWSIDSLPRVVDVKGVASRDFSLRVRLWKAKFPDVPLIVVKNGEEQWQ